MDPEEQTSDLYDIIQSVVHVEWLSTALTATIALAFTAFVAHVVTKVLRRVLSHDNSPLPSSSIFINIARVAVWAIGVSVVLSSCFGIDVSAAITALGIGGIAISLGFQDTLSNLIGGVQVSITGLVEPGDYIEVGGQRGVVRDVTWRHTSLETLSGERVVVPNSVINKSSLTHLPPLEKVVCRCLSPRVAQTLTPLPRRLPKPQVEQRKKWVEACRASRRCSSRRPWNTVTARASSCGSKTATSIPW